MSLKDVLSWREFFRFRSVNVTGNAFCEYNNSVLASDRVKMLILGGSLWSEHFGYVRKG